MTLSLDIGSYKKDILDLCHEKRIELIHFINDWVYVSFNRKLESMGYKGTWYST